RPPDIFAPPRWITDCDPAVVQGFYNEPTLEPAVTPGNEAAVRQALTQIDLTPPQPLDPNSIDSLFATTAKKRKAEFALALADELMRRVEAREMVAVPTHVTNMFNFLYVAEVNDDANPLAADS